MLQSATPIALRAQSALIASSPVSSRGDRVEEDRKRAQRYLDRIFAAAEGAAQWLSHPNDAFDGQTPQEVLESPRARDREQVLNYLSLWALWG